MVALVGKTSVYRCLKSVSMKHHSRMRLPQNSLPYNSERPGICADQSIGSCCSTMFTNE